jgi:hypothetical protein
MIQRLKQFTARSWAFLTRQSRAARIGLGVGALLIGCGCCSFGYTVGSTSPSQQAAASTQSTVTQAAPADTATQALPTATAKPKAWVTVKHLAGSGNSQSDTFDVRTGDHILTNCTASDSANLFIADLYLKGETYGNDLPYAELVDRANQPCGKDTYTVQQDGATVYLRVQADSIQWIMDVQRYQ